MAWLLVRGAGFAQLVGCRPHRWRASPHHSVRHGRSVDARDCLGTADAVKDVSIPGRAEEPGWYVGLQVDGDSWLQVTPLLLCAIDAKLVRGRSTTGKIPTEFEEWSSLVSLALQNNRLTGKPPFAHSALYGTHGISASTA